MADARLAPPVPHSPSWPGTTASPTSPTGTTSTSTAGARSKTASPVYSISVAHSIPTRSPRPRPTRISTKCIAEQLALAADSAANGFRVAAIRPAAIYGEHETRHMPRILATLNSGR